MVLLFAYFLTFVLLPLSQRLLCECNWRPISHYGSFIYTCVFFADYQRFRWSKLFYYWKMIIFFKHTSKDELVNTSLILNIKRKKDKIRWWGKWLREISMTTFWLRETMGEYTIEMSSINKLLRGEKVYMEMNSYGI